MYEICRVCVPFFDDMSLVSISLNILYTPALVLSAYHLVHVSPSENAFLFN